MIKIKHWLNGLLYDDVSDCPREYYDSMYCAVNFCRESYVEAGQEPISVSEAVSKLITSDLTMVIGETFVAFFDVAEPWFVSDKYLCEELFGPRPGKTVDLKDFIAAGEALARKEDCRYFEFGTRANPRQQALARMCRQFDVRLAAITLQKDV
ncbi:hypothetical protein Andromeda_28 [Pseudomonas phage Andromeda]|uniref:Uncharacterized protein n=1 Tax=Pseudomonas phage Andromeda TaxID=1873949 RepID=A0A1B1SEN0_9CAUD|nr:hypothetical protein BI052_gp28 [Pseudomonas phage Andromeda]ANU79103.1 hypothetical protein Andromeda_28 [Pseudomonas phage Andromeda]